MTNKNPQPHRQSSEQLARSWPGYRDGYLDGYYGFNWSPPLGTARRPGAFQHYNAGFQRGEKDRRLDEMAARRHCRPSLRDNLKQWAGDIYESRAWGWVIAGLGFAIFFLIGIHYV